MKITFTNVFKLWIIFGAIFFLNACSDKDKVEPKSEACNLATLTTIFGGLGNKFTYDNQDRIIKSEPTIPSHFTTTNFEYNSAGQLSQGNIYENGTDLIGYNTFTYNTDNNLTSKKYYETGSGSGNNLESFYVYEYNTSKQMIKSSYYNADQPNRPVYYNMFTYNNQGNVIETKKYISDNAGTTFLLEKTISYQYDSKLNPTYKLFWLWEAAADVLSPNNITVETTLEDGSTSPNISNYTYNYDKNGLVTQQSGDMLGGNFPLFMYSYTCK